MDSVLFDLVATHPDDQGSVHGGGVYAEVLFNELLDVAVQPAKIEVFVKKGKKISPYISNLLDTFKIKIHEIDSKNDIQKLIDSNRFKTLYSALPYSLYNSVNTEKLNFIMTIHGLREIEQPNDKYQVRYLNNFTQFKRWVRSRLFAKHYLKQKVQQFNDLIDRSNAQIVVVSEFTKDSVLKNIPSAKTKEITVSYSPIMVKDDIDSVKRTEKFDYFLILNGNRWIKNSYRAILALKAFYKSNPSSNIKTVILGCSPNQINGNSDHHFILKGYVSRDELERYLKFAKALIYPTLNEGFGYPPLEAMKYGTPVLTSNICSVPEVCEESVLYFDPFSVEDIKAKISMFVGDECIENQLKTKGPRQYQKVLIKQKEMSLKLCELILE